jgi:hypothetical protein
MNYQLLRKAPTNYQLDKNRAFKYQIQLFSPLPSVKGLKQMVNGSRDHHLPFYMGACWKMIVVHGDMLEDDGSSWGENRKKLRVKQHVTVT